MRKKFEKIFKAVVWLNFEVLFASCETGLDESDIDKELNRDGPGRALSGP